MVKNYGKIIQKVREEKKLTVEEFADRCMLTPGDITLVEAGKMELSREDLILAANALGISSVALAEGELIRKEDMPRLEDVIARLEKRMYELEVNIAYMQTVVEEFAMDQNQPFEDLDHLEERLLSQIDNPFEKEKGNAYADKKEDAGISEEVYGPAEDDPEPENSFRL